MKKFYLIRHGETTANREGIFRGRKEVPLSDEGRQQALELRVFLAKTSIERIISSPLRRSLDTAQISFPGREIETEELINNIDLGSWAGLSKEKIRAEQPDLWHQWLTAPETMEFPGGESLPLMMARLKKFARKLPKFPEKEIAIVSHRSVLKLLLAAILEIETHYFWKFHLDNASISVLSFTREKGFTLLKLNHTDHLSHFVFEWN